jgi:hypothetical protein
MNSGFHIGFLLRLGLENLLSCNDFPLDTQLKSARQEKDFRKVKFLDNYPWGLLLFIENMVFGRLWCRALLPPRGVWARKYEERNFAQPELIQGGSLIVNHSAIF